MCNVTSKTVKNADGNTKIVDLNCGTDGSGREIFLVVSYYNTPDGVRNYHEERFLSEAEARCWFANCN